MPTLSRIVCVVALVLATPAAGQPNTKQGSAAADQVMGKVFRVTPSSLPRPNATPAVSNGPLTVPFKAQTPRVPGGFKVTLFAKLENPRRILVLPNGDIIVAEQKQGHLTLLRAGADGKAEFVERFAQGFNRPYGLAWRDGEILVADQDGIWRVAHKLGEVRSGQGQEMLTKKGVFGIAAGHSNRPMAIEPGTGAILVGVGSTGNIGVEPPVKATIQRFEKDGSGQSTLVSGVRNTCGLAVHPKTGELWAVVQERDGLGDRLVPDFMIRPAKGAFYGWPYAYIGSNPQPGFAGKAPDKVGASTLPDLLFEAHSSAMDLVFYQGEAFPAHFRDGAFVVLRGSWNRSDPTGYKVVWVPFKDGRPEGSYQNFMTGFWVSGTRRAEVWGRPAAIALLPDGALIVADDTGGTLWRIAYEGR